MGAVGTPFGSVVVGGYSYSVYRFVLMAAAVLILLALYVLFTRTRFGELARATIQVPHMAQALGINTRLVRFVTFCLGAGLASLAGALLTPLGRQFRS